jgi:RHS repeat-associated protein
MYKGTPQTGGLISNNPVAMASSYFYHSDHLGSSSLITDQSGDVVQHLEYVPFGETFIDERKSQSSWNTPYLFSGKERDEETGLLYFGARYQDSKYGIWYSVDPLTEEDPEISSYVYCHNNPVNMIDPDGLTDFKTANGDKVKSVNDGSSAIFRQTGKGVNLHYQFTGFDTESKDTKAVNLTTAIQEQQTLNMGNPALQQNAEGNNETHCNQATQNVLKTVDSALDNKVPIIINGRANDMATTLSNDKNPNFLSVTEAQAAKNAKKGGLSLVTYKNPNPNKSGHVATYSVGSNLLKGKIANIGPAKYTGFVPLNAAIGKNKTKQFYILLPNVLQTVTVFGSKK